ncbi:MAG: hypothetical protein DI551_06325 [Micavibrio aeruginosavorus]|uniref:Glycosyltransferase family 4 protein n=1 Tax=Micavibrio aeruginosavorus TaxID=349221 RepID=A0A2W5MZN7_9BACT|nr:MAG: hypothetical protein DI551_06325 [Micavibrio aeruginosavorus]
MKVFFAIKKLQDIAGGAESILCQVASRIAENGNNVTLYSMDDEQAQSFYPLSSRVKWKKTGILKQQKPMGLFAFFKIILRMRHEMLREKPDIVIAFMHSMFVPLSFSLIGTSIPIIASEHIIPKHYKKTPHEFFLLLLSSFFVEKITVMTSQVKKLYPALTQSKIVIIPNPVKFYVEVANKRKPVILNVGRLNEQKDQETLIRAFAKIAEKYPEWLLRIVGEGNLRPKLETIIQDYGLENRIVLPGVNKDMQSEYENASIFATSSLYESFGLATAEALSAAIPCIGFADCIGTNEIIHHEFNGLLVDGKDRVSSLSDAMDRLMASSSLRESYGRNGPQSVEKFGLAQTMAAWEILIEETSKKLK